MKKVVVDTDIIIDFLRTNSGLFPKLMKQQIDGAVEIYLSSVTVMELFAGKSAVKQKKLLAELLANFQIVAFDSQLAEYAGNLKRKVKINIPLPDYIIGVTAKKYKARLATRNINHFKNIPRLQFYKV